MALAALWLPALAGLAPTWQLYERCLSCSGHHGEHHADGHATMWGCARRRLTRLWLVLRCCLLAPGLTVVAACAAIAALASGTHPFRARLDAAERPLIIVGASLLRRPDRDATPRRGGPTCAALRQRAGSRLAPATPHCSTAGSKLQACGLPIRPSLVPSMLTPRSTGLTSTSASTELVRL